MSKKIFCLVFIFLLVLAPSSPADVIESGRWNIYGQGWTEKEFVRIAFTAEGYLNLQCVSLDKIDSTVKILQSLDKYISRDLVEGNVTVVKSCDIDLSIYATDWGLKVDQDYSPNILDYPLLLPKNPPTASYPFVFPSKSLDNLTCTISLTSETSGKLRIKGYVDVDTIGNCEINIDSAIWKQNTERPAMDSSTGSGCNSGWNLLSVLLIMIFLKKAFRSC